ncbi:MAG: hypothetical protein OXJ63_00115 [Gammaproteobacteria bacterium]|nr:hypothetical protein [Gammaproteobacteria bacterium]
MAKKHYAKIRVPGTAAAVYVATTAGNPSDAKKMIQAQYGKNVKFVLGPTAPTKPPAWFK